MDLSSPDSMQRFADDVRAKETPFTDAAANAFRMLFTAEYKRLRAAQLESGESLVTLNVACRCNFVTGSVEIITSPTAVQPRPRRRVVQIAMPG